eukprot:16433086-Heterocapsa_arctica.AAC.1
MRRHQGGKREGSKGPAATTFHPGNKFLAGGFRQRVLGIKPGSLVPGLLTGTKLSQFGNFLTKAST